MDWAAWRAEFPILARKTYLNSCSLGALSRRAEARLRAFLDEWHDRGAAGWYDTWLGRLDDLRGRVARLIGAQRHELALAASISAGLAPVASAIDYTRRPRVVVSDLDFPTLAYQWLARPDVEVVQVSSQGGATIDPARFAEVVDDRTAVLAVSHVYFTTGAIQDLRALADIAHAHGALLVVDGYQGTGQVPQDVRAADVDVLLTGTLKWLLGGPGLAYVYVREELIERLRPAVTGWFAAHDQFDFDATRLGFRADARRFELGTPALAAVHTALGGQEIVEEIGVSAIRERCSVLTERLVAAATDAGFRLRAASDPARRSAIVMIAHEDPVGAVAHLAENGIIVDCRPGYVRVSPYFYNTEEEVDRVVETLARWSGR